MDADVSGVQVIVVHVFVCPTAKGETGGEIRLSSRGRRLCLPSRQAAQMEVR